AATLHTILQRYQFSTTVSGTVTAAEWIIGKEAEWNATTDDRNAKASLWLRDGDAGLVEVLRLLGSDKSITTLGDAFDVGGNGILGTGEKRLSIKGSPSGANEYGSLALSGSNSGDSITGSLDFYADSILTGYIRAIRAGGAPATDLRWFLHSGSALREVLNASGNSGQIRFGDLTPAAVGSVAVNNRGNGTTQLMLQLMNLATPLNSNGAMRFGGVDQNGTVAEFARLEGRKHTQTSSVVTTDFALMVTTASLFATDLVVLRGATQDVLFGAVQTITGGVTDGYAAALNSSPGYDAASALQVDRHNYWRVNDPVLGGAGPASLVDAAVMTFDAAAGTHKALTTEAVKINVNGTLQYIPFYP
ncbi:hypothetical protein LCGC14_3020150, partial [marine sediment metagenome]